MKKRKLLLPILLLVGLVGCGNGDNPTTAIQPSQTTSETLPTTPIETKTDLEKIRELIIGLQTNVNYTMSVTDSDGEWKSRILPNATYYDAPGSFASIDTIGYAENETGIFAFLIENDAVSLKSSYFKNDVGENLHGLYTSTAIRYSFDTRETNFAYSFALFNIEALDGLEESPAAKGMYNIAPEEVIKLLPNVFHQQNFYNPKNVQTRLGLTKDGLLIQYKGTYVSYDLYIKDIGTTTIPYIEKYLEDGNGPEDIIETSDEEKLKILLNKMDYKVTLDENTTYIVNQNYVHMIIWDEATETETVKGLVYLPKDNLASKKEGVYEYTYSSNRIILGNKTSYSSITDTSYAMPSSIFDICTWSETDYLYSCSNLTSLLNNGHYLDDTLESKNIYIGQLYISYNLFDGDMEQYSSISFNGEHYDMNTMEKLETSTNKTITGFGSAENKVLAEPIETYLNSIVG